MKKLSTFLFSLILVFGITVAAHAVSYDFDVISDGTTLFLDPSSPNDPLTQYFGAGDDFTYTTSAQGDDYWTIMTSQSYWMAQAVYDGGTRVGNWGIEFLLDGATVSSLTVNSSQTGSIHIGEYISLTAADTFDQIVTSYSLISSTASYNLLQSLNYWRPINDTFSYTQGNAPVPEPATLLLLGSGLAGLAFYRRKKK